MLTCCQALALALAPSLALAKDAPTTQDMIDAISNGLTASGCTWDLSGPLGNDGEMALRLSKVLEIPAETLMDRGGPYYDAVGEAIDTLLESGRMLGDRDAETITLTDCRG